jgi:hypothetical protein
MELESMLLKTLTKILVIIKQAWEVSNNLLNLSKRITNFTEYLQHDEAYCKKKNAFIARVTTMTDHQRNQQRLPSNRIIKQIKVGWEARVKMLQDAIVSLKKSMKGEDMLF